MMQTKDTRLTKTFDKEEVPVRAKCDVHPWMSAFIGVVPHPFHAFAQLAVGGDTLVYLPGTSTPVGRRRLAWLGDGKSERPLPTPLRFYRNLKTGPGGLLAATLLDRWIEVSQAHR